MKMYKIDFIMRLLSDYKECDNEYVGFEINGKGNPILCMQTHEPGWRDSDGFGEAVTELELLESEGEL